jgi:hypothetical protein
MKTSLDTICSSKIIDFANSGVTSTPIATVVLDALVLDNNICVLILPFAIPAISFTYRFDIDINAITGKFKRGSKAINALDQVAILTIMNANQENVTVQLLSPIEGKVSEQNDNLASNLSLLQDRYQGDGYVAILISEAPTMISKTGTIIDEHESESKGKEKICFSWIKGTCIRGNICKFKHVEKSANE